MSWFSCQKTGRGSCGMETRLSFKYDREGDILYINKRPPYPEQESEELEDEIVALYDTIRNGGLPKNE